MGQYYMALVERGGKSTRYSLQIKGWREEQERGEYGSYNGVKLMEHSYFNNSFMDAITADLYHHKAKVAWVGDYASDFKWEEEGKPDPKELFAKTWEIDGGEDIEDNGGMTLEDKYLVNHTKKQYVDGNEYYEYNKFKWGEDTPWSCIHPLSLLTACGNGLGGGDYHEDNPDYNMVGYWCWDVISIEDASFDKTGYELLPLDFCERGLKRSETYERANKE